MILDPSVCGIVTLSTWVGEDQTWELEVFGRGWPVTYSFLIVEDDASLVRSLRRLLEALGEVHTAETQSEAVQLLTRRYWTAVVVDIGLRLGNGLDLLDHPHATPYRATTLVLTATCDRPTLRRVFDLGVRYLPKPSDPERIREFARECSVRTAPMRDALALAVDEWSLRYGLTETEALILTLIAQGVKRERIEIQLEISDATVKSHIHHVLVKTRDRLIGIAVARLLLDALRVATAGNLGGRGTLT